MVEAQDDAAISWLCHDASLEVRFFFDSRAIGSIARRKDAPERTWGTLTLEDARTWIEETGLCLFLPKTAVFLIARAFVC